jgi:hypothetical protein
MSKGLVIALVLALATLGLCAAAAPALADYPNTLDPGIAAVHPWWGSEPVIWEEVDANGEWWAWSASEPALDGAPYKAIPAAYDVWFVGWIAGSPRGQVARAPGNTSIDCYLYKPDGSLAWSIKPKAARKHWGAVEVVWEGPLVNKANGKFWGVACICDVGHLPAGTYTGTGIWACNLPYIDLGWVDGQKGPTHYFMGEWDCTYSFTVE